MELVLWGVFVFLLTMGLFLFWNIVTAVIDGYHFERRKRRYAQTSKIQD